jgi:hypothetical protein
MATDTQAASSASQPRRPQVRCPACGILVYLPAVSCPVCQADMKTGFRPEKSFLQDDPEVIKATIKAYLKKWGKYGLALLIPVLAGLYFYLDLDWFADKRSPLERLVDTYPAIARPYVATQKAQKSGPPDSQAYQKRLMSELRDTRPMSPADEPLKRQYSQMKPGQQIKTTMKVFASVARERYFGSKFARRAGANWNPLVIPVVNPDQGGLEYRVYLYLLVNDPRAYLGYGFLLRLN